MPKTAWENRINQYKAAKNADQTEFAAFRYGSANFEAGIADDRTAGAMEDFDVPDPVGVESWADDDTQFDTATSDIGQELTRRSRLLGDSYPFTTKSNSLVYSASKTLAYEFCLSVSLAPSLNKGEFRRLPIAFERLARDVMQCFLGEGAKSYRTGWPRDNREDRPVKFKGLIEKLNELTGEWNWQPGEGRPENPTHQDVKDEGIDFVVWKKMPDSRKGHLFFLGQCACGEDWDQKLHDIDIDAIQSRWINPLSYAPPARVFATPRHIPNDIEFSDVNKRAGLTLDRARIAMIAECDSHREFVIASTKDPLKDLINLVITHLGAVRPAL